MLLIASAELRPLVERAISWVASWTRKLAGIVWQQISRLFGIRRVHRVVADAALSMESALGAKVKRGHNPPSPEADIQEKVEYLLRQDERLLGLINDLENQSRQQIEELRGAIEGTARELREHTAAAVRAVAETELRMRLLGVLFVVVGLCSRTPPTSPERALVDFASFPAQKLESALDSGGARRGNRTPGLLFPR